MRRPASNLLAAFIVPKGNSFHGSSGSPPITAVIGFAFVLTARRESVAVNGCPEGEVLVGSEAGHKLLPPRLLQTGAFSCY